MSNKSEATASNSSIVLNLISWLFGILFFAIGVINLFWGNDPFFGLFIMALSFVYFPPFTAMLKEKIRLSIPRLVKILLDVFILWAALGVGELFGKIGLMLHSF